MRSLFLSERSISRGMGRSSIGNEYNQRYRISAQIDARVRKTPRFLYRCERHCDFYFLDLDHRGSITELVRTDLRWNPTPLGNQIIRVAAGFE
jgi:hypothetical protein